MVTKPGGTSSRIHRIEFILVWKLPASQALTLDCRALLPWVVLMDSTAEQQAEAVNRIRRDSDLMSSFKKPFGLRYPKAEMADRAKVSFT